MPKTNDGWRLDDTPKPTKEQWDKIFELIVLGKKEEAQKMIDEIFMEVKPKKKL